MSEPKEEHLLALAQACMSSFEVNRDYEQGIEIDAKRPFGNSPPQSCMDTLEAAGVTELLAAAEKHDNNEACREYAHELWDALPKFLRTRCALVLACGCGAHEGRPHKMFCDEGKKSNEQNALRLVERFMSPSFQRAHRVERIAGEERQWMLTQIKAALKGEKYEG